MAQIQPFKGIRYNLKDLTAVICPPYDVISPELKGSLLKLSPNNFIRIELPENYEDADRKLLGWLKKKVLIREKEPAFYVCRQEFCAREKRLVRTGFFCIMKLEEKDILKHEKVSQKPISDRFSLMKRTQADISPVFGLFNDKNGSVKKKLKGITRCRPDILFRDSQGVKHRLWIITDDRFVSFLKKALAKEKVLIADGHHRFTTSMLYLSEMKKHGDFSEDKPYNSLLIYLCPMDDPGVVILPTHRVVQIHPDLWSLTKQQFEVREWDGKGAPSIVRYYGGKFEQLIPRKKTKDISVKILHGLLLDKLYKKEEIVYIKDINEAVQYAGRISGMAFLLDAPNTRTVYRESLKGRIMPHKTTYFYPKIPAGVVVYSLK